MDKRVFDPLEVIPVEIWIRILNNLSSRQICNVALVSRSMSILANDPILWSKRGASIKKRKIWSHGFDFLNFTRFFKLAHLDLSSQISAEVVDPDKLESFLSHIKYLPSLKEVNLRNVCLSQVSPALLGEAIPLLHNVDLSYTELTTSQIQAILDTMKVSTNLKQLVLSGLDLTDVSPTLLSEGLSMTSMVNLTNASLTSGHVTSLFECITTSKTLRDITLPHTMVSLVPVELMEKAIENLEKANFSCSDLTTEQSSAIFQRIKTNSSLKELVLDRNDLSDVPEKLVGPAVKLLEKISLNMTRLTRTQSKNILQHISASDSLKEAQLQGINLYDEKSSDYLTLSISRLVNLNLKDACLASLDQANKIHKAIGCSPTLKNLNLKNLGFRLVPPSIVCQTAPKIRCLNISNCSLNKTQLDPLLRNIIASTTLDELNLENINLSKAPIDLLATAIPNLRKVNLDRTQLTSYHCDALFAKMATSMLLQDLSLYSINLSHVKPALLTSALPSIKIVNLDRCQLTTGQLTAILDTLGAPASLENLNLDCSHISSVPAQIISRGVCSLKVVSLVSTNLTHDQCIELLYDIPSSTTLESLCLDWVDLMRYPHAPDLLDQSKHIIQFI